MFNLILKYLELRIDEIKLYLENICIGLVIMFGFGTLVGILILLGPKEPTVLLYSMIGLGITVLMIFFNTLIPNSSDIKKLKTVKIINKCKEEDINKMLYELERLGVENVKEIREGIINQLNEGMNKVVNYLLDEDE